MPTKFHEGYNRLRPLSDIAMLSVASALWFTALEMYTETDSPPLGILTAVVTVAALTATIFPFVDHTNKHPFGKKDVPEAAE